MQANDEPNWADDEAFWDDAWTDMDRRLSEQPRRKRRVAWWWYAGAAMALLLLLPLLLDQEANRLPASETDRLTAPPTLPQDSSPHPAVAPEDQRVKRPAALPAAVRGKEVFAGEQGHGPDRAAEEQEFTSLPPLRTKLTVTPPPVLQTRADPVVSSPAPATEMTGTSAETAYHEIFKAGRAVRSVPSAVAGLPEKTIPTIFPATPMKVPATVHTRGRRTEFHLEAGALARLTPYLSGFYAGGGYRVFPNKRLSLPVSIRYRRESLRIGTSSSSGYANLAAEDLLSGTDPTASPVIFSESILLNFKSFSTDAIELSTGISYAHTPRLRATAGVSVAYLIRARLLYTNDSPLSRSQSEDNIDILNEFSRGVLTDNSGDLFDGFVPDVTPFQFNVHLETSYDLTRHLSIAAAGTYLLEQPDRAGVIDLPAARMEVGLRWRLW